MCQADEQEPAGQRLLSGLGLHVTTTVLAAVAVLALGVLPSVGGDAGWLASLSGVWLTALLILFGELRPLHTLGRSGVGAVTTSTTFTFALLIHLGPGVAVPLQALAALVHGIAHRHAPWRIAFNVAQYTLSLAAAHAVLALGGLAATPRQPVVPHLDQLPLVVAAAAVYFVVNKGLVWRALAWWHRVPFGEVVAAELRHQLAVSGVLLGLAPLVVVVLSHRPLFVPIFVVALAAVYRTASISRAREKDALHDALTGLPNRQTFIRRSEATLAEARRRGGRIGLLLLDLDRFKEINDTLGHLTGDRLLTLVADRLVRAGRPGDLVGRLGGDEFGVLLPSVRDAASARALAGRLVDTFAEPFALDGLVLDLNASVGIALYPDHAADFESLLQRADVAMYQAKSVSGSVEVYAVERDRNTPDRLALLGDLRRALDADELALYYQPKVSLTDGSVVGLEALVRWTHHTRGPMSPEFFVQLAEETGLMPRLTGYVLETALAQAATWWRSGITVPIAVNVSLRDIHAADFVQTISSGLERYGVPSSALQLEITERVLLEDPERISETVRGLEALGVQLSLDDFGTGYSSLVHLRRMPVSEIKIDRSFVRRLVSDAEDSAIVRAAVDLAHSLSIHVVAEGVEDKETWDYLAELGCDTAQGWLISEALPSERATSWLTERLGFPILPSPAVPDAATTALAEAGLALPGSAVVPGPPTASSLSDTAGESRGS